MENYAGECSICRLPTEGMKEAFGYKEVLAHLNRKLFTFRYVQDTGQAVFVPLGQGAGSLDSEGRLTNILIYR